MKRILAIVAFALSLSSCFPVFVERPNTTVRPNPAPVTTNPNPRPVVVVNTRPVVTNIIRDFQPDRGNGGSYRVGESIFFRLTSARSGFVTMVFYNDGALPDFEIRNIAVQAGLNLIPNNNTVVAAEPVGINRVRAFYTPQPNTNVSFLNGSGISFFEDTTNVFLNFYPVELRDVKDTFVFVTR